MKLTKSKLKHIIKEELESFAEAEGDTPFGGRSGMPGMSQRSQVSMEPADESGYHRETINKTEQLVGLKIQALHGEIMRELEYGELKHLTRAETKKALDDAAADLMNLQPSNAISAVILKKLKILGPIANLLEEIGGALVAFGMEE